jgi:uncharacterized protein (TIGR03435 family)
MALGLLAAGLSGGSVAAAQQALPASGAKGPPSFEVATIKPSKPDDGNHKWDDSANQVRIENYTLRRLITVAFGLRSELQVLGGPKWIDRQAFDIAAKIGDTETARLRAIGGPARDAERKLMLQSFLADRFGLRVSRGERKLPIFALVVTKSGAKFTPSAGKSDGQSDISGYNGQTSATNVSMDEFAHYLANLDEVRDRVVLNRTELQGRYDLKLNFTRDHGQGISPDAPFPGLFTALKEQLGLELKPEKAPVDVVIVETASGPELD